MHREQLNKLETISYKRVLEKISQPATNPDYRVLKSTCLECVQIMLEPGRSLVGNTGLLLTSVLGVKETSKTKAGVTPRRIYL
jgi:diaminopimelate decarboxylase